MRLITNRTTCQMSCEPAPLTNALAHPPYAINNSNMRGTPEQLGQNILSPTASEFLLDGMWVTMEKPAAPPHLLSCSCCMLCTRLLQPLSIFGFPYSAVELPL
jgi:hypothetical protein